jgi:membrane-bound metal-dependent hydrolase YbcI (DUF457 family)
MPSPVGHALGGLIVGLVGRRAPKVGTGLTLVLPIAAAVLPDLDFLWGRHNMETHSLGAAVLAGLAVLLGTRGRAVRLAVVVALAWASHVLFDWLGSDTTPPIGVMALWPVSREYYFAHAYVFEAISRRTQLPNFWSHNLYAVAREAVMLAPVAGAAWALRWRKRRPLASIDD